MDTNSHKRLTDDVKTDSLASIRLKRLQLVTDDGKEEEKVQFSSWMLVPLDLTIEWKNLLLS